LTLKIKGVSGLVSVGSGLGPAMGPCKTVMNLRVLEGLSVRWLPRKKFIPSN